MIGKTFIESAISPQATTTRMTNSPWYCCNYAIISETTITASTQRDNCTLLQYQKSKQGTWTPSQTPQSNPDRMSEQHQGHYSAVGNIPVVDSARKFATSVYNVTVIWQCQSRSTLSVCRSSYYHRRQQRPVLTSLSSFAKNILIQAFNSMFYGIADSEIGTECLSPVLVSEITWRLFSKISTLIACSTAAHLQVGNRVVSFDGWSTAPWPGRMLPSSIRLRSECCEVDRLVDVHGATN